MQQKIAQSVTSECNAKARGRGHSASAARPSRSSGTAATLLDLQRTRGNRYTQGVLQMSSLQRQCACGGTCGHCRSKSDQRTRDVTQEALQRRGRGAALDPGVRFLMETRFGENFSRVRIHTDAHAVESSKQLNAAAYTVDQDIFFSEGRYQPRSREGIRLLAHELTHVVQQRSGAVQGKSLVGQSGDVYEREADRQADRIASEAAISSGLSLPSLVLTALAPSRGRYRHATEMIYAQLFPALSRHRGLAVQKKCTQCASGGGSCSKCAEEEQTARPRKKAKPTAHARCPSEGPCEEDPLVRHQGSGETTCDRSTGTMNIGALTEHCAGDCVRQHEQEHVNDDNQCCGRVKLCLDSAAGNPARVTACNTAYDTYFANSADQAECRAYTREVTCLTAYIRDNCAGDTGSTKGKVVGGIIGGLLGAVGGFFLGGLLGGPSGNEALGQGIGTGVGLLAGAGIGAAIGGRNCCDTLRRELATATSRKASHCAAAVPVACPFRADGTII